MEPVDSPYRRVARGFETILAQVTDDQWSHPTPCVEWDVTQLANHVVDTHQRVYSMVVPAGVPGQIVDAPVTVRFRIASSAMVRALEDSMVADTLVMTRRGEQPFSTLVEGLLMYDTLCHTWDLARAIGADETLDAEALAIAHAELSAVSDAIRIPGGFAPALTSTPDADAQTRFLNFAGREV